MFRTLKNSHNVEDLRLLAKQRLPGPIFHYIDGAADDEDVDGGGSRANDDADERDDVQYQEEPAPPEEVGQPAQDGEGEGEAERARDLVPGDVRAGACGRLVCACPGDLWVRGSPMSGLM